MTFAPDRRHNRGVDLPTIERGSEATSYDVEIGDEWRNYTSNVAGMWHNALGASLHEVIERNVNTDLVRPIILRGLINMIEHPAFYRAMNPPNGWGNYEGAREYLLWVVDACYRHPDSDIYVSY